MRLLYSHLTVGRDVFTDAERCMKIPGLRVAEVLQCYQQSFSTALRQGGFPESHIHLFSVG